jgi:hypothetical protein
MVPNCKPHRTLIERSCLTEAASACPLLVEKSLPKHRRQMENRLVVRSPLTESVAISTQVSSELPDKNGGESQAKIHQALR